MAAASSSGLGWKYDVFINFRGEDTRRGFVSHLYKALRQKPINTFIDAEDLRKGDRISKLLTAIRESRISIVVFSQNYASSTWCLKELVQILECKDTNNQIVLPIFYQVDPSDVRKLKRSFADAFAQHDRDAEMEEVRSWRSALTTATSLSGWDLRNYEYDAMLIEEIVEDVHRKLIDISSSSREENGLVEMDSHMHEMHLLLYPPGGVMNNVRIVGIWGMGGLGKTTIARAVYDEIACRFEACCFLENVKEDFMKHDKLHMQIELLSSISNNKATKAVESIIVDFSCSDWGCLNAEAFVSMTQLRLLKISHQHSILQHDYYKQLRIRPLKLLNLRYLTWYGFPLKSLPSNIQFKNIVELDMQYSLIDRLWKGTRTLKKLKFINLSYCRHLKETPDLTNVPNLETLILLVVQA